MQSIGHSKADTDLSLGYNSGLDFSNALFEPATAALEEKINQSLDSIALIEISKALKLPFPLKHEVNNIIFRIASLIINFQSEPDVNDIADAIEMDIELQRCLLVIVKSSGMFLRNIPSIELVASNAITILNAAKISFSRMDLSNVCISGANLNGGIFDATNFNGATLRNVDFNGAWLRDTNLEKSDLLDMKLDEPIVKEIGEGATSCCYSADDKLLVVAKDRFIHIFFAENLQEYHTFYGDSQQVNVVVFGNNGWLLSGGNDGNVKIWDVENKQLGHILKLDEQQGINDLHINERGQVEELPTKEIEPGADFYEKRNPFTICIAISHDCRWIAAGCDKGKLWIWDAFKKTLLQTFDAHSNGEKQTKNIFSALGFRDTNSEPTVATYTTKKNGILSIAFDNSGLIASAGKDGTAQLWCTESINDSIDPKFRRLAIIGKKDGQKKRGIAWSLNGLFAFGSKVGLIYVYDLNVDSLVHTFEAHMDGGVANLEFTKDQLLVSCGYDGAVRIWDINKKKLLYRYEHYNSYVLDISINSRGDIASVTSGKIYIQRLSKNIHINKYVHLGEIIYVSALDDGIFASIGHDLQAYIWNIKSRKPIIERNNVSAFRVKVVPFISDERKSRRLACEKILGQITVWDIDDITFVYKFKVSEDLAYHFDFNNTGLLVLGYMDGILCVLDIKSQSVLQTFRGCNSILTGLVFDSNGLLYCSSFDGTLKIWNIEEKKLVHVFEATSKNYFASLSIFSDKWIAAANTIGKVHIWSLPNKNLICELEIAKKQNSYHRNFHISFAANGLLAVYLEIDNKELQIWDINKKKCLISQSNISGSVNSLAWVTAQQEEFLVTGSVDKAVRCWQIIRDEKEYNIRLHWASQPNILYTIGSNIHGASLEEKRILIFKPHDDKNQAITTFANEIESKENVNITINGKSLLMIAVINRQIEIIKSLIDKDVNINQQELSTGNTALHISVTMNDFSIVQLLIKHGANSSIKNNQGHSAISCAVIANRPHIVSFLLGNGASLKNTYGPSNDNLLTIASFKGHLDIVEVLHREGIDINYQDSGGFTALHSAVQEGHIDVVTYLLKNDANPNTSTLNAGTSPLLSATIINIFKAILDIGVDITQQDKKGYNSLHYAAGFGNVKVASYLLEERAFDINKETFDRKTAIEIAVESDRLEMYLYLKSFNPRIIFNNNITLLKCAYNCKSVRILKHFFNEDINLDELKNLVYESLSTTINVLMLKDIMARFLFVKFQTNAIDSVRTILNIMNEITNKMDDNLLALNVFVIKILLSSDLNDDAEDMMNGLESIFSPSYIANVSQLLDYTISKEPKLSDLALKLTSAIRLNKNVDITVSSHHFSRLKNQQMSGSEVVDAKHATSVGLIFSENIGKVALRLRRDSANPSVGADANYLEFVKKAVSLGAHLIQGPESGNTALHFALIKGQMSKATILLQQVIEMDPDLVELRHIKNAAGETVLDLCRRIPNIPNEIRQYMERVINIQHQKVSFDM